MNRELWTDKYFPHDPLEIVGQDDVVDQFIEWIEAYQREDPDNKRCLLLTGNSGTGKSSTAHCLLKHFGYSVREFNGSDVRTKAQIEENLYNLVDTKQINRKNPVAIIMDEIDGISGGEKGGLSELVRYINPNRGKGNRKKEDQEDLRPIPPIVCICHSVSDKKLQDFKKDCLELHLETPTGENLRTLMKRICKKEHLNLDQDAQDLVIQYAQRDYRRLVNYLQSIDSLVIDNEVTLGVEEIEECNLIIGEKSIDLDLVESVKHLLTEKNLDTRLSLKVYSNHKSQFICSIYENYVQLVDNNPLNNSTTQTNTQTNIQTNNTQTNTKTNRVKHQDEQKQYLHKLDQLSKIINDIAQSDVVDKIMHKNQLWYLHKVHGLLSCHLPVSELYTTNPNPHIHYSSSWSKFNLQKCNEKDIYNLSSKLKTDTGTTDVQTLSQIVLYYILENPSEMEKGVELLKGYGLDYNYIKTLIKIDRLSNRSQKYTAKVERTLKQYFPEEEELTVKKQTKEKPHTTRSRSTSKSK